MMIFMKKIIKKISEPNIDELTPNEQIKAECCYKTLGCACCWHQHACDHKGPYILKKINPNKTNSEKIIFFHLKSFAE